MIPKPQFESSEDRIFREMTQPHDWTSNLSRNIGNHDDPHGPIEINPITRPPVDTGAVIKEGEVPPLNYEELPPRYNMPETKPEGLHRLGIRMQDISFDVPLPVQGDDIVVKEPSFFEKISPTGTSQEVLKSLFHFLRPDYTKEPELKDVSGVVGKVPATQLEAPMVAAGAAGDVLGPLSGKTALMLGPLGIKRLLPQEALDKAVSLLKKGASEETLTRETGMFRGLDNIPRYELPDWESYAKIPVTHTGEVATNTPFKLPQVFNHPDFYKAYPEAKDIRFKFVDKISDSPTASGVFDKSIGKEGEVQLIKGLANNQDYVKSVILHELQHFIQRKEGFKYQGSNPEWAFNSVYDELYKKWLERKRDLKIPGDVSEKLLKNDPVLSEIHTITQQLNKQEKQYAHRLYRMEPGEIEARLVQERRHMDPEFLRLLTPKEHLEWLQKKEGQDWIPLKIRSDNQAGPSMAILSSIENLTSEYARGNLTAKQLQDKIKKDFPGYSVNLRKKGSEIEVFDPSGRQHFVNP